MESLPTFLQSIMPAPDSFRRAWTDLGSTCAAPAPLSDGAPGEYAQACAALLSASLEQSLACPSCNAPVQA